jgi:hypothetical protein
MILLAISGRTAGAQTDSVKSDESWALPFKKTSVYPIWSDVVAKDRSKW